MRTVMVSGCFDVIHGGHVAFLCDAQQLGDQLLVCVAGDDVVVQHKGRDPAMPAEHRAEVIRAMTAVDEAYITTKGKLGLDFEPELRRYRPDILAATEDDQYAEAKRQLCEQTGTTYATMPKMLNVMAPFASSTAIRKRIAAPGQVPLRVDFAGGWLDVPARARDGAFVVNVAITPVVSLHEWPYEIGAGLGGSAAKAILEGGNGTDRELASGAGWQDPAVIRETGLCVWRSGPGPVLDFRVGPGELLADKMALLWTTARRCGCSDLTARERDYDLIQEAGWCARQAILNADFERLADAVEQSYAAQLKEGMEHLAYCGEEARKYCGAGWGGYALYLFRAAEERNGFVKHEQRARAIEPYDRWSA